MANFSLAPYFDDFDVSKDFYRVLFTPGKPVQTRELNTLQSILQQQIKNHGDHIFKNGAMVIPGHIFYDNAVYYVRLTKTVNGVSTDILLPEFNGYEIVGQTSGVRARVIHYELSSGTDDSTIFVKYLQSGDEYSQFIAGENLIHVDSNQVVSVIDTDHTGFGSICTINDGIYYVNGVFARVSKQVITLSKYSNSPSIKVGLDVQEEFITASDDESLYDNALGYSNYAAPGADRYKISLQLVTQPFEYEDSSGLTLKFVELLSVKDGTVLKKVKNTEYSELQKIFARRTFDESGDYEVVPFGVGVVDYRSNSRGSWNASTPYLIGDIVSSNGFFWEARTTGVSGNTAPSLSGTNYSVFDGGIQWMYTSRPRYNNGLKVPNNSDTLDVHKTQEALLAYTVYPGKAYIRGFETELQVPGTIISGKAREYDYVDNNNVNPYCGTFTNVTNLSGVPNIEDCELVNLYYLPKTMTFGTLKRQATATYTVTGNVITAVTITDPGFGYDRDNPPVITAAVGSGASLKAIVSTSSELIGIKILNGGTGYSAGSFTIGAPATTEPIIGTCRVRSFDYLEGTIGEATAKYKLQIFDVNLKSGYKWEAHVHSIQQASTYFSADIVENKTTVSGLISYTTGTNDISGIGTYFISELPGGSHVLIDGDRHIISDTVNSDIVATTVSNFDATGSSKLIEVYSSNFENTGSLLAQFPKPFMRSIRGSDDFTIDTSYTIKRRYTMSSGTSSISLTIPGETFANPSTPGSYVFAQTSGTTGTVVSFPVTRSSDGKQITITRGGNTESLEVITTINKTLTAAREKIKTLKLKTLELTLVDDIEQNEIALTEADVVNLVSVRVSGDEVLVTNGAYNAYDHTDSVDITNDFQLLTGQTPFYYGMSKIRRRRGVQVPGNSIQITFEYFDHSDGDYFSVDSYIGIAYDKIPGELRDVLDFRPRIADNGVDFSSTGSSVPEPIALGSDFACDYSYYLPRRDRLTINTNSELGISSGSSGYSLRMGPIKENSLVVAEITLRPYTVSPKSPDVFIRKLEHKRYTMADIGKLEKRIENLEYYTQLSLLEKETIEQKIVDQNGLERYKAGLLVDQFTSQGAGDVANTDYLCAMDFQQRECRAFAEITNIEMREVYLESTQKQAQHYALTGKYITLPYTSVPCIQQLVASAGSDGIISCNPYSIVIYKGNLTLFPAEDNWFEEKRRPDLIVNEEGNFAAMQQLAESSGVLGTQWNSWTTVSQSTVVNATPTGTTSTRQRASGLQPGANTRGGVNARATTSTLVTTQTPTTSTTVSGDGREAVQSLSRDLSQTGGTITSTTTTNQTRTGTQTVIEEKIDTSSEDNFVDLEYVPFIRSRPVSFKATGLKPNTVFYTFFDNINVTDYCLPLEELVITYDYALSTSGEVNPLSNAESDAIAEFSATPDRDVLQLTNPTTTTTEKNTIARRTGERLNLRRGKNNAPRVNIFRTVENGLRLANFDRERWFRMVRPFRLFRDRRRTQWTTITTQFNDVAPTTPTSLPTPEKDPIRSGAIQVSTVNQESHVYEEGDVIVQYDNGGNVVATAVVVDVIDQYKTDGVTLEKVLKMVNRSGVFNVSTEVTPYYIENISSGVRAKVLELRKLDTLELRSNSVGTLIGEFLIPNREDIRFPIGNRKFFVTDDPDNDPMFVKTSSTAEAEYHALGLSKVRQTTVTNTRNSQFSTQQVVENRSLTNTNVATIPPPPPPQPASDPVAQTFQISESTGAFITGATFFFTSKPTTNIGVFCQLKSVENGYPGGVVYAQKFLTAEEVSVYPDTYVPVGTDHTGTTFKFDEPVYLEPNKEYCIVVGSSSPDYYVRIARMGSQEFSRTSIVSAQPATGSLFTSQNSSTWSADQTADLTFILHKAKFDITRGAVAVFANKNLTEKALPSNALYAVEGSNEVRVNHPNHGFQVGDKVTLANVLKGAFSTNITGEYLSNAFDESAIEATYTITSVEYDFYTIEIVNSIGTAVNAVFTSSFGGSDITASYHIAYSTVMPSIEILDFDETDYNITIRGTYGDTLDTSLNSPYTLTGEYSALNKQNIHFTEPMLVASYINEKEKMLGDKSFTMTVNMTSFNENLSPMLNVDRLSAVFVRNKINNPTKENTNVSLMDDITVLAGDESVTDGMFTFNWDEFDSTNHYMETDETSLYAGISKLKAGKYIYLDTPDSGTGSKNVGKELLISKLEPTYDGSGNITRFRIFIDNSTIFDDEPITDDKRVKIVMKDRYVDELTPEGSSTLSTYVAAPVKLADPCTGIRVTIDTLLPIDTTIDVWYRTSVFNSVTKLLDERWYPMSPLQRLVPTNDFQNFVEVVWEINDLKLYDNVQTKVVFRSDNNAVTPRIKNFRMMALA